MVAKTETETPTPNPTASDDAAKSATSSLLGGNMTGKTEPPKELPECNVLQAVLSIICTVGIAGSLGGYGVYVGEKYLNTGAALCKSNANWLLIWGASSLASIPMYIVLAATRSSERVRLYWAAKTQRQDDSNFPEYNGMRVIDHLLISLSSALSCFAVVWGCVGIAVRQISCLLFFPHHA